MARKRDLDVLLAITDLRDEPSSWFRFECDAHGDVERMDDEVHDAVLGTVSDAVYDAISEVIYGA